VQIMTFDEMALIIILTANIDYKIVCVAVCLTSNACLQACLFASYDLSIKTGTRSRLKNMFTPILMRLPTLVSILCNVFVMDTIPR